MEKIFLWPSSIFLILQFLFLYIHTELIVNVKNQGGDVYQETIWANVSDDTINLQIKQPDGTIITQFIDFRNEIQIINALVLGEEEQREREYQIICFITHFRKTDFIPSDAMAKLRQKNPWNIRMPEKELEKENITLDALLDITSSDWISPHIKNICSDAKDTTYAKIEELESIVAAKSSVNGNNEIEPNEMFLRSVKPFPVVHEDCSAISIFIKGNKAINNKPCICQQDLCIGWFPCALKHCRGKYDRDSGKSSTYRCGIHTCKICRHYSYTVPRKSLCMWVNF